MERDVEAPKAVPKQLVSRAVNLVREQQEIKLTRSIHLLLKYT